MKLANCVLTFDTGMAVLRPLRTIEDRDREWNTTDARGEFTYRDELRLTPARIRAIRRMLHTRRTDGR